MTRDRPHIWTMLHFADQQPEGEQNRLVEAWTTDDGLLCAVFCIRNAHYTGYVQLPSWVRDDEGRYPDEGTIRHRWNAIPYGGITYGPDKSGWVGFDMNHGPEDLSYDSEGNVLPNNVWEAYLDNSEYDPLRGKEPREWTPQKAREETAYFAQELADYLWRIREGEVDDAGV